MHDIILGLAIGLASGASPGPMQSLVLAQAVRFGWRAGAATALAPLVTDILIVGVTVGFVGLLPKTVLDVISLAGGLFIAYLAQESWRSVSAPASTETLKQAAGGSVETVSGDSTRHPAPRAASFGRATLVNLLNPHAWLFWAIIGAPLAVRASRTNFWDGALFVVAFYVGLIGLKVTLALVVGRGVTWLGSGFQKWVVRASGVGLAIVAVLLLIAGLRGLLAH